MLLFLAVQCDESACPYAVGPCVKHGLGLLESPDAAGCLDAHVWTDVFPEKGDIFYQCAAGGKTSGGFDEVRP